MRRLLPERGVVLQQYMASETTSEPRDGSGHPRGQLRLEGNRVGLKHPQGHGEDDGVGLEGLPCGEGGRESVILDREGCCTVVYTPQLWPR